MKAKSLVAVGLAVVTVSAGGLRVLYLSQAGTQPPAELIRMGPLVVSPVTAVYEDLKRSWYEWDTIDQSVVVTRRERQTTANLWDEQSQEVTAAFYIVDARIGCPVNDEIKTLYVAGVYPSGEACIEKWVFTSKVQSVPYVPISQRPLPQVKRTELYRENAYGAIRCIEPDPDGRFLLFLTLQNPALYKLPLPSGGIQMLYDQSTLPRLADAKQIVVRQHSTEGRHYHLLASPRWEIDLSASQAVTVLRDTNNDGSFESAEAITMAEWANRGYTMPGPWSEPCQ